MRTPVSSLATTRAQRRAAFGFLRLDPEPRVRADEPVPERALAHGQAERVAEPAAKALVGQRLETLVIDRQGVNARSKRRCRRHRRRRSFRLDATPPTAAREAAMTHDIRFDRRNLDLVVFADPFERLVGRKRAATRLANIGDMVAKCVGMICQPAVVRRVPRLCPARTRVLALLFLARRRRI